MDLLLVLLTRFLPTTREHIKLLVKCPAFLRINCLEKIDGVLIALRLKTFYTNTMWWCTFSAHHTRTHHKAPCFEKINGLFIALTLYTNSMWWCTIIDSTGPGKPYFG